MNRDTAIAANNLIVAGSVSAVAGALGAPIGVAIAVPFAAITALTFYFRYNNTDPSAFFGYQFFTPDEE